MELKVFHFTTTKWLQNSSRAVFFSSDLCVEWELFDGESFLSSNASLLCANFGPAAN